ncbi:hypothetical protein BDB00DRAFT_821506 [Zychaea mexicana]|uniref:uncharacterized protein n=1 Tax=Zychaea mexicana TaxID=64656 RepID=UPI0022FEE6EA|nr:uncharacterized protein BDB00DRAFT_821506 [Zychaea mexicana]KAI9493744.1 hypothetical protein BDB00DRAFT_821506 [Zychaea mexicana]
MILILLQWWKALVESVQFLQHTERTSYFESLVEIVSRNEFLYYDQAPVVAILGRHHDVKSGSEWAYLSEYHELLNKTLSYAIDTADVSAVHPGTIIFCAHILAQCFFKVPGLASALLQTLPVQQDTISSIRRELVGHEDDDVFPKETSYRAQLCKTMPAHLTSRSDDRHLLRVPLKSKGHWISRWKTSDRSLFIMFYQRYHIHLSAYIHAAMQGDSGTQAKSHHHLPSVQTRNAYLAVSPGYVHFAAYMTEKVSSLLRSSVMEEMSWCNEYTATAATSATSTQQQTPSSAKTIAALPRPDSPAVAPMVTPAPTAAKVVAPSDVSSNKSPPSSSLTESRPTSSVSTAVPAINVVAVSTMATDPGYAGKPRTLESATRRYAYCLTSCAIDPAGTSPSNDSRSASHHQHQNSSRSDITVYHDMINVWLRAITKSISWTSPESVFCLIDFLESVITELKKKHHTHDSGSLLVDIPFILHTIHLLLAQADNTIVHMRTLAFVFTNFGFLTQRAELLDMLCNRILLHPYLFERFIVHWNSGVRIFFLQCLFWRIRPLWSSSTVQWGFRDTALKTSACDGSRCWSAWHEEHNMNSIDEDDSSMSGYQYRQTTTTGSDSITEHRKCTLEIHITLETLLASFLQQYTRLDLLLKDIGDRRDRHAAISRLQTNTVTPILFLPSFTSQLTLPSPPPPPKKRSIASITTTSTATTSPYTTLPPTPPPHGTPYLQSPSSQQQQEHRRRSRVFSNNLKVATRRLSRTFLKTDINIYDDDDDDSSESCSSTPPRRHSTTTAFASAPTLSEVRVNTNKSSSPKQYYTVPSTYMCRRQSKTASSINHHQPQTTIGDENVNTASSNNQGYFNTLDHQESGGSTSGSSSSTDSSTCEDSAYASGRTTPTGLPSIFYSGRKSSSSSSWMMMSAAAMMASIPENVSAANGWRYAPTAHTYAAKAVAEMDLIMNSSLPSSSATAAASSAATRRMSLSSASILKKTSAQTSPTGVPEISVDWPKAWSSPQF